jgi:hypothetical protein
MDRGNMDQKLRLKPSEPIHDAFYDPETERLTIQFAKGGTSAHHGVPQKLAQGLQTASSHGKFYNEHIRGKFEHSKVR